MASVKEILDALFAFAPAEMKYDWDNVGLLCGRLQSPVSRMLVALDCTVPVIEEAKRVGAQLIVTHHPLIFGELRAVNDETITGRSILMLAEAGIAAVNLHTNLDCAPGGVNDVLAQTLRLQDVRVVEPAGTDAQGREYGLVRAGYTEETSLASFAAFVKETLRCPGLRYADGGRPVRKVAVGGGACGSEIAQVLAAGCDTFVTADLKYNHFLDAKEQGLNLIDAGHFETENPVCAVLCRILRENFPDVTVLMSNLHEDPVQFL